MPEIAPNQVSAQERMWRTLAKHAEVSLTAKTSPEPPTEPAVPLKWRRTGEYAVESEDRLYRISKALVAGQAHYQAYKLTPQREWYYCIGGDFKSFEAAKAAVERHRVA